MVQVTDDTSAGQTDHQRTMTTPIVTEQPRRLEATTRDPFADLPRKPRP